MTVKDKKVSEKQFSDSQIAELKEMLELALEKANKKVFEVLNKFSSKIENELLKSVWYLEPKVAANNLRKMQEAFDDGTYGEDLNTHPLITNSDEKIDYGLFMSKLKEYCSRLSYVKEMKVPKDKYKELSWEDKIRSFHILPENWDGEGALKVKKSRIESSIKFLKKHQDFEGELKMVYPSMIGSVGMIYRLDYYKINILFTTKDKLEVYCFDTHNSKMIFNDTTNTSKVKSLHQFTLDDAI